MTVGGPRQFSLAYLTVFGSPARRMVEIAAETDYDFVSLRLAPVTEDEPTFPYTTDPAFVADVVDALDEDGVSVLDVELIRTDPGTKTSDWRDFVAVAEELGARHIITQIPEPDIGKAVETFQEICDLGARGGMTVDLEFIPWTPTNDLATASQAPCVSSAGHGETWGAAWTTFASPAGFALGSTALTVAAVACATTACLFLGLHPRT